uniref:Uncharacterized protein n=1 Tax=Megaselia scalaris TaxID=36166 RepID=T1H4Y1_MEGSC
MTLAQILTFRMTIQCFNNYAIRLASFITVKVTVTLTVTVTVKETVTVAATVVIVKYTLIW